MPRACGDAVSVLSISSRHLGIRLRRHQCWPISQVYHGVWEGRRGQDQPLRIVGCATSSGAPNVMSLTDGPQSLISDNVLLMLERAPWVPLPLVPSNAGGPHSAGRVHRPGPFPQRLASPGVALACGIPESAFHATAQSDPVSHACPSLIKTIWFEI